MLVSAVSHHSVPLSAPADTRPKRPGSLSFASPDGGDSQLTNGRQKLQGPAFTTLLSPGGGALDTTPLPDRYQRFGGARVPDPHGNPSEEIGHGAPGDGDGQGRKKDLESAIKWIRQELMLMKQQDRLLMRQLLNLRSKIHQIRSNRLCYSFGNDLYSSDESWMSFASDEALSAPCTNSPITEAEMLASFRNRTLNVTSVPTSPDKSPSMPQNSTLIASSSHGQKLNKIIDITYYV